MADTQLAQDKTDVCYLEKGCNNHITNNKHDYK